MLVAKCFQKLASLNPRACLDEKLVSPTTLFRGYKIKISTLYLFKWFSKNNETS